jgi:protein-disulfide isomerase-like protein with CxxC motif
MLEFKPNRPTVVWFHMLQCSHCERMKEAWNEASDVAQKTGVAHIQDFEAGLHPTVMQKYDIKGYPTVKLFWVDGRQETYNGDRSTEDLLRFITKEPETSSKVLVPRLIWLHMEGCFHCKNMEMAWIKVKNALVNNPYIVTEQYEAYASPDIMKKFSVEGFPTLILVKPEGQIIHYHGDRSFNDILTWANAESGR